MRRFLRLRPCIRLKRLQRPDINSVERTSWITTGTHVAVIRRLLKKQFAFRLAAIIRGRGRQEAADLALTAGTERISPLGYSSWNDEKISFCVVYCGGYRLSLL